MHAALPSPLFERDRFFAGPPTRRQAPLDAQSNAVERLVARCEQVRSHLRSVDTLESFIGSQQDPSRIRRRIGIALAFELSDHERAYGFTGRAELEAFRSVAQRRLAAVVWVFG